MRHTVYTFSEDPTHARAWSDVCHEQAASATVYDPTTSTATFRAWRISSQSWAWQTSAMPAPAFARYGPVCPHRVERGAYVAPAGAARA